MTIAVDMGRKATKTNKNKQNSQVSDPGPKGPLVFPKFFQEHDQIVKQFGARLGLKFCKKSNSR